MNKFITTGSILTTITVLFQSAPVFLSQIGLALSPFSTLPMAIASYSNISLGFMVYFSSLFILLFISTEESLIFLFTTGLIGFVIGTFLYRKGIFVSTIISSITLSLGIIILTYVINIFTFITIKSIHIIMIFFFFSILYTFVWNLLLKKIINYLIKIKVISPL
jgi:hypothetical protein